MENGELFPRQACDEVEATPYSELSKIISGGQTGVDRAALDVAMELGFEVGGWCPKGRRAEDGPIDTKYPLVETPTHYYPERTAWNVRDSDGTLILYEGEIAGGTRRTIEEARKMKKPRLVVDLENPCSPAWVWQWLREQQIRTLNVAGPRESERPGIYERAANFLRKVLQPCKRSQEVQKQGYASSGGTQVDENPGNVEKGPCN